MSTNITFAAIATALTILSIHGTASAQSDLAGYNQQSNLVAGRATASVPSNAFGSTDHATGPSLSRPQHAVVFNSKIVGHDPDVNVRSTILRDGVNMGQY